ncbi:unnamed protein product [Cylindrotheca closterium]|uniref:Uncharacterized protein n=1 Tax=Cylindrotheca closterium TaxID=2856 RepID=A0AAD2G394_9STRA|nr:unnamed protein product [Cylindrotheca closterium]
MSGPNNEEAAQGKMEVSVQPLSTGTSNAATTGAPRRPIRRGPSAGGGGGAAPERGVTRNRSGPMQSRSLPIRGVNRNRSGPMRGVTRNKSGPRRGVSRTTSSSNSKNRALPLKTNSFHRSVPDRARSGELRKFRRQQNAIPESQDTSVSSGQTNDSIQVRKNQISGIPAELRQRNLQRANAADDYSVATSDLDGASIHTMDSMMFHHKHVEEGGFEDDGTAFEESFISTATYMDDFGDDDFESDMQDGEDQPKIDIEMQDLKIEGGKKNDHMDADDDDDDDDDEFEEEELK